MKTLDHTVQATSGRLAASTSDTPRGTGMTWPTGTATCSAYPPPASRAHTSSATLQRVGSVDRGRCHVEEDLTGSRLRRRDVSDGQDLGASGAGGDHGSHGSVLERVVAVVDSRVVRYGVLDVVGVRGAARSVPVVRQGLGARRKGLDLLRVGVPAPTAMP